MAANICTLTSRILGGGGRGSVTKALSSFSWSKSASSSNSSRRCMSSQVELTSVRYKDHVSRGNYGTLEEKDITHFVSIVGQTRIVNDSSDLEGHNTDWIRIVRGASRLLLKPKTTEELSQILKYCNQRKLAVCPQGGNTGLVGGSVPVFDEIIVSTLLMNQIINVDEVSGVLTCQAGCVLEVLNEYLLQRNYMMPLDLGAKGSCHIGGNVSTNAGGLRLLRYGSLHSSVLGVEAVLADGTVLDCMSEMKKDNTGYDLKHLFIGSEGTLGIVSKVAIHCPPKPNAINLALLGLNKFESLLEIFKLAKRDLGEILSSCEYVDLEAMNSVTKNLKLRNPIGEYPFYMLIECSGSNSVHDEEKLNNFLSDILEGDGGKGNGKAIADGGTVASDTTQMLSIWKLRESIAEALMHDGYVYKYDLSLPLKNFDALVCDMKDQLKHFPVVKRVCGYGHIGDGNIHFNVTTNQYDPKVTAAIEPYVYEYIRKHRGSISAEHGLGFKKSNYISYSKSPESIAKMKDIKKLFDPNGILNPYKVLPTH